MEYSNSKKAVFLERPNRFIARCLVDGTEETVHVKNTGRCRELLTPGAAVILEKSSNPQRKTKYDLISVYKDGRLVNIDSAAPNKAAGEFLQHGGIIKRPALIKPEAVFGASRLDFYIEGDGRQLYAEVKGVTLRVGDCAVFPDAPTARGAKHMKELAQAVQAGYEALALFVVQMKGCTCFKPNDKTDPAFCTALRNAAASGVHIKAMDCVVDETSITLDKEVPILL